MRSSAQITDDMLWSWLYQVREEEKIPSSSHLQFFRSSLAWSTCTTKACCTWTLSRATYSYTTMLSSSETLDGKIFFFFKIVVVATCPPHALTLHSAHSFRTNTPVEEGMEGDRRYMAQELLRAVRAETNLFFFFFFVFANTWISSPHRTVRNLRLLTSLVWAWRCLNLHRKWSCPTTEKCGSRSDLESYVAKRLFRIYYYYY